jgi:hypothetical protein
VIVICILGVIYFATTYSVVTSTVCMSFNGRAECRTATGVSRDVARSAAVRSACGALTAGRRDLAACVQTTPSSVTYR